MIEFTEAKEVPNTKNPEGTNWLSLGYKSGKRNCDWTFGNEKAYLFMSKLDEANKAKQASTEKYFKFVVTLKEGTKYAKDVELTNAMLELLNHYKADIMSYLERNPFVPYHRTAIENPVVKTEEVGIEYLQVLYLPCWEKGENDDGEGLIPKKITQKTAKFILEKALSGNAMSTFATNLAKKDKAVEIVDKYKTRTGEISETKYDIPTQKCLVKYKTELLTFAMMGKLD